ncbi:MAG TPA: IS110 family transposase [Acetobacteraceae bacterium]|nr:IS110 family transposase [Acetobacteraceae bacterium]
MAKTICGVDVSSTALDARIGHDDGPWKRFDRTHGGIAGLVAFCRDHAVDLVVMEATGGYERLPFGLLWAAAIPTALINPRAVRRFAEAMGLLEKTDRIDAGAIAWYAEVKRLQAHPPASATQARLTALVTRLRQLTELRVTQLNQRRLADDAEVLASLEAVIALLTREIRAFETRIAALIGADPLWRTLDAQFRTIKGVAGRTVARLMAELPEIGTLSGKAIGKLAGLAPIARDSGAFSGKRPVRGGREGVRSILFIVAEGVRRYDPDFMAFHRRLSDAGKPPKVVRTALAHKLLTRLNAKARDVRKELAQAT